MKGLYNIWPKAALSKYFYSYRYYASQSSKKIISFFCKGNFAFTLMKMLNIYVCVCGVCTSPYVHTPRTHTYL